MLDFCGTHNITPDVGIFPIQKVNEAYERLLKSDVKYRFGCRQEKKGPKERHLAHGVRRF
jgi:D-arabinose 1-dehydrogenase-like Zn-dependent alcohol dehydrogenase